MLFIEMRALPESDKKLRPIGIFTRIGHCYHASSPEFQSLMGLVLERLSID